VLKGTGVCRQNSVEEVEGGSEEKAVKRLSPFKKRKKEEKYGTVVNGGCMYLYPYRPKKHL